MHVRAGEKSACVSNLGVQAHACVREAVRQIIMPHLLALTRRSKGLPPNSVLPKSLRSRTYFSIYMCTIFAQYALACVFCKQGYLQ